MALTRLDNLISSKTGKYLYVSPDDFNASDVLNNRGNSPVRPFKSLQRAFLEIARYSYLPGGPDNDRFDQFTVMVMPGKHYIDNRPGLVGVDGIDAFTFDQALSEWSDNSNLDIGDPDNVLYKFNNTEGGAIIPRGSSIIGYDLRRTSVHPLYVPDPADRLEKRSAIFNVTGGCYFWQFTIRDGDLEPSSPLYDTADGVGKVYNQTPSDPDDWGNSQLEIPNFSHHKLTVFEYADKEELGLYYRKVAKAFSQYQPNIDNPNEFGARIQETRIVGPLSDIRSIESIRVDDRSTEPTLPGSTTKVTVTTKVDHGYFKNQFIAIENNGLDEEIDGTFSIDEIDETDGKVFSYTIQGTVSNLGSVSNLVSGTTYNVNSSPVALGQNAASKAEVDSVESASPYVFNCSIRSTWGICGIWANGLKATGFKSVVIAQYTGVSLQKDDRAFIRYDEYTNTFNQASLKDAFATVPYHTKGDAFWKDDWRNFHVRASEDSFIQCVSIFAVGFADHFLMESGGDMSITNSNSNFGNTSLHAKGHKGYSFNQDKGGYIDAIIPPKIVPEVGNTSRQSYYTLDIQASNDQGNHSKLYIGDDSAYDPTSRPAATIGGYRIGAKSDEKIFVKLSPRTTGGNSEFYSTLTPNGFKKYNATPGILNPSSAQVDNKDQDAANLIEANKEFIAYEAYGYITSKYPALLVNQSIEITKCRRDIGYLLDATISDLRLGGNINTIQAAESYYVKTAGVDQLSYIDNELTETLEGYYYARDLAVAALRNYTYKRTGVETTAGNSIIKVGDSTGIVPGMAVADYAPSEFEDSQGAQSNYIKDNATRPAQPVVPDNTFVKRIVDATTVELGQRATNSVKRVASDRHGNARELILANKTFIATEAYERMLLDFPNYTPSTGYNATTGKVKCIDDLELAIAAIAENTGYGGNADTWDAAYYYDSGSVQDLAAKKDETIRAFNYCKDMAIQVMRKENVFIYGTHGLTQSATTANDPITSEPAELVNDKNGDARDLILANKNLIAHESVERMIRSSSTAQFQPTGAVYNPTTGDLELDISQHNLTSADSYTVGSASYEPTTGVMTVTITGHDFANGEKVKFDDNSLTFSCTMGSGNKQYPRPTDPVSGKWLTVFESDPTNNTFKVNVGESNLKTFTPTAANYDPNTGLMTLTIGNHGLSAGTSIQIAPESLKFSCGFNNATGAAAEKLYPRSSDPFYNTAINIESATTTTITVQVLTSIPSTNLNPHTFIEATAGAIVTGGNYPHTFQGAASQGLKRAADSLRFDYNAFKFECDMDSRATQHTYPRIGDPAGHTVLPINSTPTSDKVVVNVGKTLSIDHDVSTADYNPNTGDMTLDIGSHNLQVGTSIVIADNSLRFKCAKDNYQSIETYPRPGTDPFAGKAIEIKKVGASYHKAEGADYDVSNGIIQLTVSNHGFADGDKIQISDGGLTFTCAMDNNATEHSYPRESDPASGNWLTISDVEVNTFKVNVGPAGINSEYTPTNGSYDASSGELTLTIGTHTLEVGTGVVIKDNSLAFTCTMDGNDSTKFYPRINKDNASSRSLPIISKTDTEITVNVGNAGDNKYFKPSDGSYNPKTGNLDLNIGQHGLAVGSNIVLKDNSLKFKCDKNNGTTVESYPRPGVDPKAGKSIDIDSVGYIEKTATGATYNPTTGDLTITSNGHQFDGPQEFSPIVGLTAYNPTTGILTLNIPNHGLENGEYIRIKDGALLFKCDKDNKQTTHAYPRSTDPFSNKNLVVTNKTQATIDVNVGVAGSFGQHAHEFAGVAFSGGVTSGGDYIQIVDNSLAFTCDLDPSAAAKTYPRQGFDYPSGRWLQIRSKTANEFVVNVGKSSNLSTHTADPSAFVANGIRKQTGVITINVGQSDISEYTPGNATSYDPTTGLLVLDIGSHSLTTSDRIRIADGAMKFKCEEDNKNTEHAYPRASDPISGKSLAIQSVGSTTVTIQVLDTVPSTNVTAHEFVIDSGVANSVTGGDDYIHTWDSALEGAVEYVPQSTHTWAASQPAAANAVQHKPQSAHTFKRGSTGGIQRQSGTITVNVGVAASADRYDHVWDTAGGTAVGAVTSGGNYAHYWISSEPNSVHKVFSIAGNRNYHDQDCVDDVRDLLEAIADNVAYGGNDKTWDAAYSYKTGAHVAGEETETNVVFNHAKEMAAQVIKNQKILPIGNHGIAQSYDTNITADTSDAPVDKNGDAYNLLISNAEFIAHEAYSRMILENSDFTPPTGNPQDCKDDINDFVVEIAHNVGFGGNDRVWDMANLYVTGAHVEGEEAQTLAAFKDAKEIMVQVARNEKVLSIGSHGKTQTYYNGTSDTATPQNNKVADARNLILANKNFVAEIALGRMLAQYSNYVPATGYTTNDCLDDLKDVVDAVAHNLGYGGNERIWDAANMYVSGGHADGHENETIKGFNEVRDIIRQVIINEDVTVGGHTTLPQAKDITITNGVANGDCDNAKSTVTTLIGILTNTISNPSSLAGVTRTESVTKCVGPVSAINTLYDIVTNAITIPESLSQVTRSTGTGAKCDDIRSTIDTLFAIVTSTVTNGTALDSITRNVSNGPCQNVASTITTLFGILTNTITTVGYLDSIDKTEIPLGLELGQSVNANSTTTDSYLWFTWPTTAGVADSGVYTTKVPNIDTSFNNDPANVARKDTTYPECNNQANAVRQYFANIGTIIQSGLGSVTRNEPASTTALSKRSTVWTLVDPSKQPPVQNDPHKLETGTPVRLVPRPKTGKTVDKRNVRLPNGFNTNQEYYVIAPGRSTYPQDFSATTSFNGDEQDVLMLASSKENAAAGIYLHSAEVDGIHPDIEIDLYQFTIDDKYDLHQYICTLVSNGIQTDVSHIFDLPQVNVPEGHPVFFRSQSGKDLPTVGGTDAADPAVAYQSGVNIGKLRDDVEFYARYINEKVFKIYRTHANAIADFSPIDLTSSPNIGFNVFANKRTSPMRFDPTFANPNVSDKGKWFLQVEPNSQGAPSSSQEILARLHDVEYNDASGNTKTNDTWYTRLKDERTPDDRIYRFRYVIPSYLKSVRDPLNGFTIKMRKDETRKLLPQKIVLKPKAGNTVTKAVFNNTTDSGQANEIIGWDTATFANPGGNQNALDLDKRYDPFKKDLTGGGKEYQSYIKTDSKIQATIQSGRYFIDGSSGDELLELTVFDHGIDVDVPALKNEILTTVKITTPQGGTGFIANAGQPATGYHQDTKVEWDGNDKGSAYIHAALPEDPTNPTTCNWHLILKGISGTLDYNSNTDTRFTQTQSNVVVFADQLSDADHGKSLVLKEMIRKGYNEYYYKQNSASVYTLTPGDEITDQAGKEYYIASVHDVGEIDDTFYIFSVETIQRRIFEQQDGIFYLTAVRGNISPYPTGAGNLGNFRDFKFSQPISKLYPLNYKNDPVWFKQLDVNLVDPPATYSAADNYVHGLVTVNDFKGSITKEAVIDFLATPSLVNNTYTGDNIIQAQSGNATSGSEDRQIPISGDNTVVVDQRLYVELRRPSIARAGNHTFEYLGFGPGNYSTGLPIRQEVLLTSTQDFYAQSKKEDGGLVFYTGLNSNGDLYIGNRKIDAITGEEEFLESATLVDSSDEDDKVDSLVTTFDTPVTFNKNITVNGGDDGKLVNTFNSPVTVNVASSLGLNSLTILSTVNPNATPVGDDETLDRSTQQGNQLTNGDIVLNKNMIAASIFQFNPRGSNGFAQAYKIQNHVVGASGSNISPSQSSDAKDYFDSTQVVRYGTNGPSPVPGDMLLKGDSVGASGSIGWIYANSYYTLGDQTATNPDNVFNLEFDGSTLVKINWKNSKKNKEFNPKITSGTKIRIKDCSQPELNGVHNIHSNSYNEDNTWVRIVISASLAISPIVWNSQATASMEYTDTAWKEWGVLGSEAIRTETSALSDYRVGINTIARSGGTDAWKTAFVNDSTAPRANLDVEGNGIITGYSITYGTGTFTGLPDAFVVGTFSPAALNNSATFRINVQQNRVGINVSDDKTANTELDRSLVVDGDSRFTNDAKFEQDIDVDGGGPGVNNTAEIRTAIDTGTFEFLMNSTFEGDHSAYVNNVGGINGLKIGGSAKNIEIGDVQASIQEIEVGTKAAKSWIDLGSTPDGDGTNAHISRISIGGAFDGNETDSYTQIGSKELKIAGDILLGQVKDKDNNTTITKRGAGDTAFFRSTAETVSFLGDNSATTVVDFATNASQITIAGQGGSTTIRNNTKVEATLRVNSDITLCGGTNNFTFKATRKQAGSTTILAHTNGILGNNIFDRNVDVIDVLRVSAPASNPPNMRTAYNRIDTGGFGAWGNSTWTLSIPQAGLPALPVATDPRDQQYYLPLKFSPFHNVTVINPDGDQYFNENDILLIDTGEGASSHPEFVKIVALPKIVSSNNPYHVTVVRQPFGTFTGKHENHLDETPIYKCIVQNDSTWITEDIDTVNEQKTIKLAQFGGTIDVDDYLIISRADGTPANDGVDDEGEIFKLDEVIEAVAKKLMVKNGCDSANENTVFEVNSVTGEVTIGGDTIVNGSLSLVGGCDPDDHFTIRNADAPVYDINMCNGNTIIGTQVGQVYVIGGYYGSTPIAHNSTSVVTSYMYDPQSINPTGPKTTTSSAVTATEWNIPIAGNVDAFVKGDLVALINGSSQIEIILVTDDPYTTAGQSYLPTIYNAGYPANTYPNGGRGQEGTSAQAHIQGVEVVRVSPDARNTSLIDPIAATGRVAVPSPNINPAKIQIKLLNSDIIGDKVDYTSFVKIVTGGNIEWFYVDSIDGNPDTEFGVRMSKSTRLDANGNFSSTGTLKNNFGGGTLHVHDDVELHSGSIRMYGSDGKTLAFNVANDDDHYGDGSVRDEKTGYMGMYVNGAGEFTGDLRITHKDCQSTGVCNTEVSWQAFATDGSLNMGKKLYIKGAVSANGSSSDAIVHVDNLGAAGNAAVGPRDFIMYQDCSIDAFGISRYFTRNGGRRYTYVEQSTTGIGQTQAAPLQPNNNYLINTSAGSNIVMYLPDYAETGDMIRFVEVSGNLTYNTSLVLRALKVNNVAVPVQGDSTGTKIQAGAGSMQTAWDSGELVVQTRNASFGLIYVGATDAAGDPNASSVPSNLRGWWLTEL